MARKIAYWVTTALIAVMSLFAAFAYLSGSPQAVEGFAHVGYPQQLRILLVFAKPLGAIALIVPGFLRLKEWAYAGFTFAWIAAFIAHYLAKNSRRIHHWYCWYCWQCPMSRVRRIAEWVPDYVSSWQLYWDHSSFNWAKQFAVVHAPIHDLVTHRLCTRWESSLSIHVSDAISIHPWLRAHCSAAARSLLPIP